MADTAPPTAAEIVADIRTRKMTAVSAVRAALERAEQAKDLNAFIFLNADGALAAADRVDSGETTGALGGASSLAASDPIPAARPACRRR